MPLLQCRAMRLGRWTVERSADDDFTGIVVII